MKDTRIEDVERKKLISYLKKFYSLYPKEHTTVLHFVKWFKIRHKGRVITINGERKRVGTKQTFMPVIANTGGGKSYFCLMCSVLYGRPFDLVKNVSYMPEANEISDKLNNLFLSNFIVDEGAVSLRSVNWQNKDQQRVTQDAQTERFKANWVFINLPNYQELTKSIRTGSSEYRAFIPYRTDTYARVIIQKKSKNFRNDDPWADKLANKVYETKEARKKEITNEVILEIERNLPNYVMDFIIPNLEIILPNVCSKYLELKQESRISKEEQKKDFWKDEFPSRAVKVIYNDELGIKDGAKVTYERVAKVLNISRSKVAELLK